MEDVVEVTVWDVLVRNYTPYVQALKAKGRHAKGI